MANSMKAQNLRKKFQRSYVKDLRKIGNIETIDEESEDTEIKADVK